MSEPAAGNEYPAGPASAGRLLREARERQGLHIAALAAAIKVPPKKLESLEADRFDQLPDATFTRALAQTVCRALKTDPAPVMRLLPAAAGYRIEQVGEGLNAPFRERPGSAVQRDGLHVTANPVFWIVVLIFLATVAVYLLPARIMSLGRGGSLPASAPGVRGAVEPGMPPDRIEAPSPALGQVPGPLPGTTPVVADTAEGRAGEPASPLIVVPAAVPGSILPTAAPSPTLDMGPTTAASAARQP